MSLPTPSLRINGMALFVFLRIYPTQIERKARLACCTRRHARGKVIKTM
jgi:hypothetical protein